jgi:hypothetical protein
MSMAAMGIFIILIAVQSFSMKRLDMPVWLQVVVTLVPVLPLIWAFSAFRHFHTACWQ